MSNSQSVQPPTIEPSQNQVHQDDSTPDMMQYPSSMARQSFTMSGSGKEVFENENDDRVIIEFGSYLGRRNG